MRVVTWGPTRSRPVCLPAAPYPGRLVRASWYYADDVLTGDSDFVDAKREDPIESDKCRAIPTMGLLPI